MPRHQQNDSKFQINMPIAVASGIGVSLFALLIVAASFHSDLPATAKADAEKASSAPSPNRVVGAWLDQEDTPCAQQAWPYIQQKCLSAASPNVPTVSVPKSGNQVLQATPEKSVTARPAPTTDGVAVASEVSASQQPALKSATTSEAATVIPRAQSPEVRPRRKAKGGRHTRARSDL